MKNWLLPILFFALACFFSFQWGYYRGELSAQANLKLDSVITVLDTVTIAASVKIDTVAIGYPVYVQDSLTADDSLAIFNAYFATSSFAASATANQVEVRAKGWVWQNRLDSISFSIKNLRPTQQIFNSYQPKTKRLNLGMVAGNNFAAPIVTFQGENWGLLAGYNLISNNVQPTRFFGGITYSLWQMK